MLNIPISLDDTLVNAPQSWMQLCIIKGLFDEHTDTTSSLVRSVLWFSHGFYKGTRCIVH